MLRVGITGGIGSGKSTAAHLLAERGAVVADADAIAREVVAPGTAGLAQVAAEFPGVVVDGQLDRAALAAVVFGDPVRRRALEAITHPLIGARTAAIAAAVPPGGVLVHDVPLLVEAGMGAAYHLVVVVDAPLPLRLTRLEKRGLPADQARQRIAQQASDDQRCAAADVVIDNGGSTEALAAGIELLWPRLAGYASNLAAGSRPPRGAPVLVEADPDWPRQAGLLTGRLTAATGKPVHHIGSTAVPGLAAKDVLDLMLTVTDMAEADALASALAGAGFVRVAGIDRDEPKVGITDPVQWAKRLHGAADPGRAAHLHVRAEGTACWRFALAFRDWPARRRAGPRGLPRHEAPGHGRARRRPGLGGVRGGQGGLVRCVLAPPAGLDRCDRLEPVAGPQRAHHDAHRVRDGREAGRQTGRTGGRPDVDPRV